MKVTKVRQLGGIVEETGEVGDGGAELDDLRSELTIDEGRYVESFNGIDILEVLSGWFLGNSSRSSPR